MKPQLVHARKAKMMLASSRKTDKLDAHGMNRIHAKIAKYGTRIKDTSDILNRKDRAMINQALRDLGPHIQFATAQLLDELDLVEEKIPAFESKMAEVYKESEEFRLLRTIPGIGCILSVVIASEIGDVRRFASASRLAAYSRTTPGVHASGGTVRYGRAPADVNHYLKWAFAETSNTIMQVRRRIRYRRGITSSGGGILAYPFEERTVSRTESEKGDRFVHERVSANASWAPGSSLSRMRHLFGTVIMSL